MADTVLRCRRKNKYEANDVTSSVFASVANKHQERFKSEYHNKPAVALFRRTASANLFESNRGARVTGAWCTRKVDKSASPG